MIRYVQNNVGTNGKYEVRSAINFEKPISVILDMALVIT